MKNLETITSDRLQHVFGGEDSCMMLEGPGGNPIAYRPTDGTYATPVSLTPGAHTMIKSAAGELNVRNSFEDVTRKLCPNGITK